jgi:lipoprotein signal peptidase
MRQFTHWLSKAWLVLLVAAIVILLDQWTKNLIRANLEKFEVMRFWDALGDYFVFEHVDNYGAAFGIFQGQGNFFIVVAAVVAIGILVYVRYLPTDAWIVRVLLGLQLGGALGNVIDRINQGYVCDRLRKDGHPRRLLLAQLQHRRRGHRHRRDRPGCLCCRGRHPQSAAGQATCDDRSA